MRASNQDGAEQRNGRDVGASERGTGDRGKARFVADTSDGSGFAIGDAEGADSLLAGALRGLDSVSQALAEAEGHQSVSEIPTEGGGKINADNQNATGFLHLFGERDDAGGIDGGLQRLEIAEIEFHVVANAVGDGTLFLGGSFQNGVGSEARDEVGAEVGEKPREFAVAESLDGANDGGGVHLIALREFARGQEIGVLWIFQNHAQQFTAAGIELGLGAGKTAFEDR